MGASKQDPKYSCAVVTQSGSHFDLSNVFTGLDLSERKGQIAACARIRCVNVKQETGYLNMLISVRDRVTILVDDGERQEEVFRGFIWTVNYSSNREKELTFTCYDALIYLQESEENRYFSSGKSSKDICSDLCSSWNVQLDYRYESITHGKLPLKGKLSDIFLSDILDEVKKKNGKKYVMRSTKDVLQILPVGSNETVYELKSKGNVLSTKSEISMDGMITTVKILGRENEDGSNEVKATKYGKVDRYGTLQKIQNKDEDTSLADAEKEAQETIKEKGVPTRSYTVEATDIPWIRKGDKVNVSAGDMVSTYLVIGITHSITAGKKTMSLELENGLEA